jgi:hypothetical protein
MTVQVKESAEWTPFQTHYFSENLVAPGIEPGTSGSVARNHYTTEAVRLMERNCNYEDCCLLGCDANMPGRYLPKFQQKKTASIFRV